jgi:outer membrane immunogenic protein
MRLKSVFTGVAALSLISVPALAADPIPPPPAVAPVAVAPPAPAPAFTWTGGYIGGHAGIGRGALDNGTTCEDGGTTYPIYFIVEGPGDDIDWDQDNFDCDWALVGAFGAGPYNNDFEVGEPSGIAGYLIGTQIGFNWQLGQGNVGFVLGAEVAFSMTSLAAQLHGDIYGFEWNSEFRINYLATATLRAGLAFNRFMIYGEGGLALVNATWVNTLGFSDTVTDYGYVYGAGIEAAVAKNV